MLLQFTSILRVFRERIGISQQQISVLLNISGFVGAVWFCLFFLKKTINNKETKMNNINNNFDQQETLILQQNLILLQNLITRAVEKQQVAPQNSEASPEDGLAQKGSDCEEGADIQSDADEGSVTTSMDRDPYNYQDLILPDECAKYINENKNIIININNKTNIINK